MSYSTPYVGLGAAAPTVTATGLMADAVRAVNVPAIQSTLSPSARMATMIQGFAFDAAVGKPIVSMPDAAVRAISDSIGETASQVATAFDMAGSIPLVGAIVQFVGAFVSELEEDKKRAKQEQAAFCQDYVWGKNPLEASAASGPVPADLFHSFIGGQLIQLLEGGPRPTGAGGFTQAKQDADYAMLAKNARFWYQGAEYGYGAILGQTKLGVPVERRRLFRKLREAIEAQWRPKYTSPLAKLPGLPGALAPFPRIVDSDGGVALFAVYLDLVTREYDEGHITPEFLAYLDCHMVVHPKDGAPYIARLGGATAQPPCTGPTWSLIDRAINTVHPTYVQGLKQLQELEAQLKKMKTQLTLSSAASKGLFSILAKPKTTTASASSALPKATAPKPATKPAAAKPPYASLALGVGAFALALLALKKLAPPKKRCCPKSGPRVLNRGRA